MRLPKLKAPTAVVVWLKFNHKTIKLEMQHSLSSMHSIANVLLLNYIKVNKKQL
jgi:hypothetical protein